MAKLSTRAGEDGPLFCLVYADELAWQGVSTVRFDVRKPDACYLHYAVEQPNPLKRDWVLQQLLLCVRAHFPKARLVDLLSRAYIEIAC